MDSARADRLAAELQGAEVAGWRVQRVLGAGKSAIVFEATRDGRQAALKIFDPELEDRYGAAIQAGRIERERGLVGKHHPHLIEILDGGRCPTTKYFFITMGLVSGKALNDCVPDVPRDSIRPIIRQVASAAKFLEDNGLAHRDIKPANIVLSDDGETATLLDLGVLRPIGASSLTDHGGRPFIGTLRYAPPEFLLRQEDDSVDGWRAITFYQLGAVLHDLIMRRELFAEYCDPYAMLAKAVESEVPRVEAPDVAGDLIALARTCLTKDWKKRLSMLTWDSFLADRTDQAGADARARVRSRRIASQSHAVQVLPMAASDPPPGQLKVVLQDICAELRSTIRNIVLGSPDFPSVEFHKPRRSAARESFGATFAASTAHQLFAPLHLGCLIRLVDPGSRSIELWIGLRLGGPPLIPETTEGLRRAFVGAFETSVVGPLLEDELYFGMDEAEARFGSIDESRGVSLSASADGGGARDE